jgi:hypothetical protein
MTEGKHTFEIFEINEASLPGVVAGLAFTLSCSECGIPLKHHFTLSLEQAIGAKAELEKIIKGRQQ